MTNTEMWLDETISHIKSVKSDIWMLHEIMSLPNCNDCKNKDCEYKPKWGEHIRYNCPLHNADRKTEPIKIVMPKAHGRKQALMMIDEIMTLADLNSSEKPNNSTISKMEQVETMSCAECKHRPIGAEICEEPCHYEPQTDWHYDEQDATWYPYKHEDEPKTQMKTQNSNLIFEKRTMRDCYNCKRYETEGECVECHYEPKDEQTEREGE